MRVEHTPQYYYGEEIKMTYSVKGGMGCGKVYRAWHGGYFCIRMYFDFRRDRKKKRGRIKCEKKYFLKILLKG